MKYIYMLAAVGAVAPAVALPANQPRAACTNPEKRIEWRELDPKHQKGYLDAVNCLTTKPSRIGLNSTLYDDFPHVHWELNNYIHGGSPFLPWHRYFTHVYFNTLKEECGYEGPGTYWDWTLDYKGLRFSPVMSSENGFGGDGSETRTEKDPGGKTLNCVDDGPFSDLRPAWLQWRPNADVAGGGHCFYRKLLEVQEPSAYEGACDIFGPDNIAQVKENNDNWDDFKWELEGGPHGMIHASLGGEMNPTTSPNEPLFFLHHPMIDRIWWQWQQMSPEKRLSEYYGKALHYGDEESRDISLDDKLPMLGLAEDVSVREVMDISERLCYTY